MAAEKCILNFSGGTDSTCVAALLTERFQEIHLLTFFEEGTKNSPAPLANVERLQKHFPKTKFIHSLLSTDKLVRAISYRRYFTRLQRHGFFQLATPGFSSLSWQLRAIVYAKQHGIQHIADGLTRELMQFPGHRDEVIAEFRKLHASFGLQYENPVREWPVPRDQQFLDRLIVDRHGFVLDEENDLQRAARTTGEYLYKIGLFPHPNVKGSQFDREMQHDCYPFVLYNLFVFWLYLPFHTEEQFSERLRSLFSELCEDFGSLLSDHLDNRPGPFEKWL
jgi:hypothetical protein